MRCVIEVKPVRHLFRREFPVHHQVFDFHHGELSDPITWGASAHLGRYLVQMLRGHTEFPCVESHITVRPVEVEPDLSSLLTIGEESKILQTLIDETEAAKEKLIKARTDNTKELCSILHHLMPTWMKIRSEKPLRDLYLYLNSDEGFSKERLEELVDAILRQCDTIISMAEKRREELV